MQKLLYIFIFIVFAHSNVCFGQEKIDSINGRVNDILTEVYHFKLSKYDRDISSLKSNDLPENQYYYLKANWRWWHILNGYNDEKNQKICIRYIDQSIDAYKYKRKKYVEDKLTLLSAYILKMRVNNLGNHKLKSARLLLKILDLSEKLIKEITDEEQKTFVKGVYHYFTSYAKDESIFAKIFLYGYTNESKEKGLKYLVRATQSSQVIIRTEAHYLLYKIYSTLENNKQKALENAKWLSQTYPENIFYKAEYYLTLCDNRLSDKAMIVKDDLLRQVAVSTELDEKEKQHYYKLSLECKNNL